MSGSRIEITQGKPYAARIRPRDVGTVDTDAERSRNHGADGRFTPANEAARNASAKRTLTRNLRQAVQDASGDAIGLSDVHQVARDALALYAAAKRSVGCTAPLVLARLLRNAVNDVLADRLTAEALKAGVATERGAALLELAHRCEQRAERNLIAALAAAKALGGRKPERNPLHADILAAGELAEGSDEL